MSPFNHTSEQEVSSYDQYDDWTVVGNRSYMNSCQTVQEAFPDPVDNLITQFVFGFFYALFWLIGVLGNVLVVYVAACRGVSFTVRTVFILSLACSDLIICMTSLPVTAITTFTRQWIFPSFLCYPIGVFQGSGIFVSSFTLTAIALDRYLLIVHPTRSHMTYQHAVLTVLGIWFLGYMLALPVAFFSKMKTYADICGQFCQEQWPEVGKEGRKVYGLSVLIVQYGLPLCLCCLCYWSISRKLRSQIKKRQRSQVMLPESEQRLMQRRRRTNRMMVSMVASFLLAWFPLNAVNLIRDYELYTWILPMELFSVVFAVGHLIAMTSVTWNPIIYSWYNESFRNALKNLVPAPFRSISDPLAEERRRTADQNYSKLELNNGVSQPLLVTPSGASELEIQRHTTV